LLTRRPEVWEKEITAYTAKSAWESKGVMKGKINVASKSAIDVIPGS
jgi:hypothetical protein